MARAVVEGLTVLQVYALSEDGSAWQPGTTLAPMEHRTVGGRMWYRMSDSDELIGGIDAIHWPDEGGFEALEAQNCAAVLTRMFGPRPKT